MKKAQEDFSLPGAVDFAALETAVIAVEALVPFPELRRAIGQKDTNQIAVLAPQLWTRKNGGQTLLDILSESYRPIFFENLKAISPLLVYSGSDTEVQEWMLTIDKVCRWWP